jgi:transposase
MYIREVKKQRSKDSQVFYQYNLVQSSRIDGKVRQRVLLYLGSDPALRDKQDRATVLAMLKSMIFRQPPLFPRQASAELQALASSYFEKFTLKYGEQWEDEVSVPPGPRAEDMELVALGKLEVRDVKSFGGEHLCRQVLDKLGLQGCLEACGFSGRQSAMALMAIAARAIFASSEHKTAQILETGSEMKACFGWRQAVTHKQLYAAADLLWAHRQAIDAYLYERVRGMFGLEDRIVIFDISNTYFETSKQGSSLARYGRSKEKRHDCPIVVFTGVIDAHGFIKHSRIYQGNKPDAETLPDMLDDLERHAGSAPKKTVVLDAGIATEDNLRLLRQRSYDYVCVSRSMLKSYPAPPAQPKAVRLTGRGESRVELMAFKPEGYDDTWMYVRSAAKEEKESSMAHKLSQRFEQELEGIKGSLSKKGGTKKIEKVWERIGRARQKHGRASGRYHIRVEQEGGIATDMRWERKADPKKEDKEKGVYFIRTSYPDPGEQELWDIYNTIREVEATFRCLKSDLHIRPVHHQKDERIQSHIYLTILAYQLANTIRYMLKQKGLKHDWKNILRIMSTQTAQTVTVPSGKKTICLRKASKPMAQAQEIYRATGCKHTQMTTKKYVVYH